MLISQRYSHTIELFWKTLHIVNMLYRETITLHDDIFMAHTEWHILKLGPQILKTANCAITIYMTKLPYSQVKSAQKEAFCMISYNGPLIVNTLKYCTTSIVLMQKALNNVTYNLWEKCFTWFHKMDHMCPSINEFLNTHPNGTTIIVIMGHNVELEVLHHAICTRRKSLHDFINGPFETLDRNKQNTPGVPLL